VETDDASRGTTTRGVGTEQRSSETFVAPSSTETTASSTTSHQGEASAGAYVEGYWEWFGSLTEAAIEAEPTSGLAELTRTSDIVIVGQLQDVVAANMVELAPGAPSSRVQFVTYTIASRDDAATDATFQLAVPIRTDELENAVQATIDPEDTNGDGELDDAELAAAIDYEAIAAVYDEHWDAAVKETVAELRHHLPQVETLFFLRRDGQSGEFRPVNGDSIIVNDSGIARIPWREGEDRPDMSAVQNEVSGRTFGEIVSQVAAARPGGVLNTRSVTSEP